MKFCTACRSPSLIACDGDIVCRLCGLVDSQDISDEGYGNINHVNHCYTYNINKIIQKACDVLDIPDIIGDMATVLCKSNRRKDQASVLYTACQIHGYNISKDAIAYGFQINTASTCKDISLMNKPHINHRLFPVLEELQFDRPACMSIINHVVQIEKRLLKNHRFVSKKPSKTDGVIVFYICQTILQKPICKKIIIKTCNISLVTFSKNLKLVEEILKNG